MKTDYELNTNWRKVASTIYSKPVDSKIFASVEVDVTELEEYISNQRKQGIKLTLTHILTLIIGRAFRYEVSEMNTFMRRGKVIQ